MEDKILTKLDEMTNESKANKEAIEQKMTAELGAIEQKLTADIKVGRDEVQRLSDDLTDVKKSMGKIAQHDAEVKTFSDALGDAMKLKEAEFKNYRNNRKSGIVLDLKAPGIIGSGNFTMSGTNTWMGAERLGAVGRKPYEMTHIRDIVNVVPIQSDAAYTIRQLAGEPAPDYVAMGALKPISDADWQKVIQPVSKIAHYYKIPEELLNDLTWLRNEIAAIGVEELLVKEDDALLNWPGTGGKFTGLTLPLNSTAFAAPASLALSVPTANNYDVLIAALTQLRIGKTVANYVVCNPADYASMLLTKSSTGEYPFGAPNVGMPNVFGVPIIASNAIASDKFLVGDFSKATIGQREGISVRFYDQNEDDAIKNLVTVVIEERLTIVVDRADRLIYGDFSDARAALLKP